MAGTRQQAGAVPVSDLAAEVLDPVMRRRAGLSIGLIQSWSEIVGERLAETTRPERLVWPRRAHEDDPFQPATLVIACDGMAAHYVQHETGEIVSRVNAFLGFQAVERIKILQKPVKVQRRERERAPRALSEAERGHLSRLTERIEHDELRASLEKLGQTILARKGRSLANS